MQDLCSTILYVQLSLCGSIKLVKLNVELMSNLKKSKDKSLQSEIVFMCFSSSRLYGVEVIKISFLCANSTDFLDTEQLQVLSWCTDIRLVSQ